MLHFTGILHHHDLSPGQEFDERGPGDADCGAAGMRAAEVVCFELARFNEIDQMIVGAVKRTRDDVNGQGCAGR